MSIELLKTKNFQEVEKNITCGFFLTKKKTPREEASFDSFLNNHINEEQKKRMDRWRCRVIGGDEATQYTNSPLLPELSERHVLL